MEIVIIQIITRKHIRQCLRNQDLFQTGIQSHPKDINPRYIFFEMCFYINDRHFYQHVPENLWESGEAVLDSYNVRNNYHTLHFDV